MAVVVRPQFTTYPAFPGTARMLTAVCSHCFRIFASPCAKNLLAAERAHSLCCTSKRAKTADSGSA